MKSRFTRSAALPERWLFTGLIALWWTACLLPSCPRSASAQTYGKNRDYVPPVPTPPPTGHGAGVNREPVGSNVPRNAPTKAPPADCKASAAALRQQYDALTGRYNGTQDEDEKHKIRAQIQDLQTEWESLAKDCGNQGSLGGGPGGGSSGSGGRSPGGSGSSSSSAGGGEMGGGGGGGGPASAGGSPAPAPGAPPEHGLTPVILTELLPAHLVGRPVPTATGPIHALDRLAWRDLQDAWARVGHLPPARQGEPPGAAAPSNPGAGGGPAGMPGGSGFPAGGSAGAGAPATGSGALPAPSAQPVALPDDATEADRLGAAAVEARRAEAADLNAYAQAQEQYQQAEAGRDTTAMLRQAGAMLQFADKALTDARAAAEKQHQYEGQIVDALNAIQAALAEQGKSWPKALEEALARVRKDGLPSHLKEKAVAANVPQAEIDGLQSRLASYTPSDVEQGVADLKARYNTAEEVRSGLAARGARTTWPPPPDIAALETAQDAARRLKEQATASAPVVPAPAPPPAAKQAAPAARSAFAGIDPWWLIPAVVVLFVLVLVVYGIRRRARRAGGAP